MQTVDILMATYNGSDFIRNQILSLQQQTDVNWKLFIRDDFSTDNTVAIVNEISSLDSRIILIKDELGNIGPGKSFIELTRYSESEYAIFCDQDDIWFERKIENLKKYANIKLRGDVPGLVYCDAYGYNSNKGVITLPSISTVRAENLNEFLFFNSGYQGCSILFNKFLCNMLKEYTAKFYLHDDITSLIAHVFGDVHFLDDKLMLYRQHDKNVTGNVNNNDIRSIIKRALNTDGAVLTKLHYDEKKCFYDFYKDSISIKDKELFKAYFKYPELSLFNRLLLINKYGFKLGQYKFRLLFKTLFQRPISR
ncbi:glycosyltransferase family 2 protein [Photobacterium kishitanii]|uniref:glycosyltransferase family 2 protein n=1 Tax=Photobacterium kishitanii TaxID=318456 RepID=UPI0005D37FEE|nr:glycosyltransferase family 2 protein [Photobacterium kishitanii]KJG09214.1 hypothetical protein UB40_13720 [Photobacterium kishitanii]PSV05524.1 glycosyltransferase family 2 protein [Photobacterium kishitanii]PSV72612.1 glycosyltransferase family 2 protein [Photobacterium kishitanii]